MKKGICIDCGKEFSRMKDTQIRCPECQKNYRTEMFHNRYLKQKEERIEDAVYRRGHRQVCTHVKECFYGGTDTGGCSYILETGRSRIKDGHFIVDGKCDAFEPKGKKKMKRQKPISFGTRREKEDESMVEKVDKGTDKGLD